MIHHVYANRSNIGDWLSARGIRMLLGDVPVVEHLGDEPFVADTLATLCRATADDLVVIGGGGLFMDYFDPLWSGLAQQVHAPALCLWGIGFCDLKRERSHPRLEVVQEVVRRSALCFVRDEMTRSHLGMPGGLPMPVPCPSLCALEAVAPGWGVLHVDSYDTVGAAAYERMDEMCRQYAQRSSRPFRKTNNRIDPPHENQLAERLRRYQASDLVVSSALHGCIIAAGLGRPVVAVSGDTKIEGFMRAAGLGDWVLDMGEVERLPQLLEQLAGQPDVSGFAARAREGNSAIARAVMQLASTRSRVSRRAFAA